MSSELEKLGLSGKVRAKLETAGIDTVEKLVEYGVDNPYTAVEGIGAAGAAEITAALAAGGEVAGDDDDADAGQAAAAGQLPGGLADPDETGISPGERGRRIDAINRFKDDVRREIEKRIDTELPKADTVTRRGCFVPRRTTFNRGGTVFSPPGEPGETVVAKAELNGECTEHYLIDALASGLAYAVDESVVETDDDGNRYSPAVYAIRLAKPARVGNGKRPASHVLGRLMLENYRIPVDSLVGLFRTRAAVFEPLTKSDKTKTVD